MNWQAAEREYTDWVIEEDTLPRMFETAAERHADRPAQGYKGGVYDRSLVPDVLPAAPDGEFATLTYAELRSIVHNLAAGFRELGVEAGDRVAIFGATRMEWAQSDFALLAAGAVVTTVYASSSEERVHYLLDDPDASGVVVENDDMLDRVLAVEDDLDLSFVVAMDDVDDRGRDDVLTLADLHDLGAAAFDPDAYDSWLDERDLDDLASLIYTSGTTGLPKGVRLTHGNFRANVNQVQKRFGPRPDKGDLPSITAESRAVSYLPLAHVFERLAGHFFLFGNGASVFYAENPDTLADDLAAVSPTLTTSVPRVYERMYDAIRSEAESSAIGAKVFPWASRVGRAYYEADDPGLGLRVKRAIADRLVFANVRAAVGDNVDYFVSGGGSLSPELCALYHGMGLPISEGYGLTETSPVLTTNPPEDPKVGTIGPPVIDVEVHLDESKASPEQHEATEGEVGELLVQGPNVTDGYWNMPEKTAEAFTEDVPASEASGESEERGSSGRWFRTGDIIEIRPDGYLRFLERVKQMLVLSTGKNVAPAPIEDAFAATEFVEQAMVVGDEEKFVGGLLVPNFGAVERWADREGIDLPDDPQAICEDDRVRARVQRVVDEANRGFESYEQIKQFRLVPEEFTEENDLLTPSLKKKRRNILDRYADEVADIYAE